MPGKKILVIEDEIELADTIMMRLKANNYRVILAHDGQDGLNKARKEKPDLIILDLMLPKLDGFKVCRLLKFDYNYNKIPIIMLTARAQGTDKEMGEEVGADIFLTKPFEPSVIIEKIKELLEE